jgi:hypothetical protein
MLEASLLELGGTRSITGNALGTVTATVNSFATRYDFVEQDVLNDGSASTTFTGTIDVSKMVTPVDFLEEIDL